MTSDTLAMPTTTRYAGLDGLRAIAVALVLAYHLFPTWILPQGFVGVDVFFVISGFLITSLLLRERAATGRTSLSGFWSRRARRLVPALVTLIAACGAWAWFVGGDLLVGLGRQVISALTFSFNWASIANGTDYFSQSTPELFRNLWSLAVEEQFYVVWPLLLPLVLLLPWVWARVTVAVIAAAGSAWWMGVLVTADSDPTRAYFGTDSHGFGILLGIALAFLLAPRAPRGDAAPARSTERMPRRSVRVTTDVAGALALAALIVVATLPSTTTLSTFPGALLSASILTAVVIAASTRPGSVLGRSLDVAPLRWIGARSYGIYLWHWPVVVLLAAGITGVVAESAITPGIGFLALGITLIAATASYAFIERPIQLRGFAGVLRLAKGTPQTRFAALAIATAGVLAACATTGAISAAPSETSAESVVSAGQRAIDEAAASAAASPAPTPTPTPTAAEVEPTPQPTPVTGDQITAVGDSVMLASAPGLLEKLPGIQIDAAVSRSMWAGPAIIEQLAANGQLRPYVVVGLGTNGPVDASALENIAQIVGPDRELILVNAYAPRNWIDGVNTELTNFAASHPGVVVADWVSTIAPRADLLAGDQIHPGPTGGGLYADMIGATAQGVEDQRVRDEIQAQLDREALIREAAVGRATIE